MNLITAAVQMTPDTGFIGSSVAQDFVDGIGFYALIFCLVGLILSAGLWAVGAFSNNYTQSVNGKKGFLITAAAALVIGGAPRAINYFFGTGTSVQ